jgi:phage portal protein BeeE
MGLLERIDAARTRPGGDEARYSADQWIGQYLIPSMTQFSYGGTTYPIGVGGQTMALNRAAEIPNSLLGYSIALRQCPPAFAAQMVRSLVLSQARFTFRARPFATQPRRMFGNRDLGVLETPWPNGTTGDLTSRMEWDAGLAGNAFVLRQPGRLRVLRPDWTAILYGSQEDPDWPTGAIDAELLGYVYANRGIGNGDPHLLLPDEVAHWSPLPDPEKTGLGMSWLTPAIREMQGDRLATEHEMRYWENGATPSMVVKGIPALNRAQFDELVEEMEARHAGVANAYRTLYLTAGADVTVVGSSLRDLDLEAVQGSHETRISILSRVPAALLGISKGLSGSSLNAGNLAMTRRIFSDTWVYPALQDMASSLAPLVNVPADAELWFDTGDMPILREDAMDAANIEAVKAVTITNYVKEGFTPDSAIAAVRAQDVTLLKHSGLVSVQLQPPGSFLPGMGPAIPPGMPPPAMAAANGTPAPPAVAAAGKPAPPASSTNGGTSNGSGN